MELLSQIVLNDTVLQVALTAIAGGVAWTLKTLHGVSNRITRVEAILDEHFHRDRDRK